jgi:hypothetical protein
MDDKPTKRGGGTLPVVILLVVLILLPMIYVLSVGPAVWMATSGRMNPRTLEAVYWPLEWTANNVPVAGPAIVRYVELWDPQVQPVYSVPPGAPTPSTGAIPTPAPASPPGS